MSDAEDDATGRLLRILIVGLNTAPELVGIGKYTGEMARWFAERGHAVEVVAAPPYYPDWKVQPKHRALWYRAAYDGQVRVQRCPLYVPVQPSGGKRLLHHLSFAGSSLPAALWQARRLKPDVVIGVAPSLLSAPAALAAARLSGARAWLHVQDLEVDAAFDLGLLKGDRSRRAALAIERHLMRAFDRISAISDRMVARIVAKGIPNDRVSVFPNWVDCNRIQPLPSPQIDRGGFGLPNEGVVALYSGNLGRKQGLDVLIETAEQLADRGDIHFALFGQGPMKGQVAEAAARLPNVYAGDLVLADRLNDLLNCADIHLLPQSPDAADLVLPSKLTGMLASGRPVIATTAPGTGLHAMVQGCGITLPDNTAEHFASAVSTLADDATERQRLGEAARNRALDQLETEAVLGAFECQLLAMSGQAGA